VAVSLGILLMLVVRGVLLWVVIPLSDVWWLLTEPARVANGKPHVGLAETIGWANLNLVAVLTLGRLTPFTSWSRVSEVEHRISLIDPV